MWDRRVEAALLAEPGGRGVTEAQAEGSDEGAAVLDALLDDLVPRRAVVAEDSGQRAARIDVSMGVGDETTGRRLAPRRPGTQFLTLAPLCDAIARRDWAVAVVDLSDLLVTDQPDAPSRVSVRGSELVDALLARVGEDGRTVVLTVAAEGSATTREDQRRRRGDPVTYGMDYAGVVDLVAPWLEQGVAVRVYGVLAPPMVAVVELGLDEQSGESEDEESSDEHTAPVVVAGSSVDRTFELQRAAVGTRRFESDEEAKTAEVRPPRGGARRGSGAWRDGKPRAARWSNEVEFETTTPRMAEPEPETETETEFESEFEPEDESESEFEPEPEFESDAPDDEDVPLAFDNTLGSQAPMILEYVVILGEGAPDAGEGMTLVEVPPGAVDGDAVPSEAPTSAPLRAQLAETRRQADLSAIERQALVERLDNLESANTGLKAESAELRDRLARALAEPAAGPEPADDGKPRLDAALAEVQSLRWELTQTKRALDAARARPVEVLEAEVARLAALLDRAGSAEAAPPSPPEDAAPVEVSPSSTVLSANAAAADHVCRPGATVSRPHGRDVAPLVADIDRLLRRVERSDMSALELRTCLLAVRGGLWRFRSG